MPWITDNAVLTAVASIHRLRTPASAPEHWAGICATANEEAYERILEELLSRGYDLAGVNRWRRRALFNRRGAICFALRELGLPEGQEGQSLTQFCEVWKEIETVQLFDAAGDEILPVLSRSRCRTGSLDNAARPHAADGPYFGDPAGGFEDGLDGRL